MPNQLSLARPTQPSGPSGQFKKNIAWWVSINSSAHQETKNGWQNMILTLLNNPFQPNLVHTLSFLQLEISHGAVGWITQTKRSLKNNYMDTSGMTPEKFWHQNFFPPVGLPLNKILKNCWRAPWPARWPEILHSGHWPQYATFIFYTNFCARKFLLTRF